jgi:Icc-related predicted phosphoesterase
MRIVCVSDTHMHRPWIPDGDILIHAGDMTTCGDFRQVSAAAAWLRYLPHYHKIVIAGNHDWLFQREPSIARQILGKGITYLQDECTTVEGLTFYGSSWTPYFQGWAFNVERGQLWRKWERIPEGVDFLVTHGPSMGILDRCNPAGEQLGCAELSEAIVRVSPRFHVFGHIHPGYGECVVDGTRFVNAAHCRDDGGFNDPIVIDL